MAGFAVEGVGDVLAAFEHGSDVPDEVKNKVLEAMADVVAKAQKQTGESMNIRDEENQSGQHILDKIKINKPKLTDDGGSISITFSGTRTRGNTTTRNAEIAFINEFGADKKESKRNNGYPTRTRAVPMRPIKPGRQFLMRG